MKTCLLAASFAVAVLLSGCAAPPPATTQGEIALANLDEQLRRQGDDPAALELWLLRLQFQADYSVLDRVAAMADAPADDAGGLLRRARARMAVHRFADARADFDAARATPARRAALLMATGRGAQALPVLEAEAQRRPGFASHCALARGMAAVGRLEEADGLYLKALSALDTTSPFPMATIAFARGLMWSEQGGDKRRGAAYYAEALRLVPNYPAAAIHLAEIDMADGNLAAAEAHLLPVVIYSDDPEALGLLGELHRRQGLETRGQEEIDGARRRFEALLAHHPAAFADHAAEFYLGLGSDPQRAWTWARANLRERSTRRAFELAIRAAEASGRTDEASSLREIMNATHAKRAT